MIKATQLRSDRATSLAPRSLEPILYFLDKAGIGFRSSNPKYSRLFLLDKVWLIFWSPEKEQVTKLRRGRREGRREAKAP